MHFAPFIFLAFFASLISAQSAKIISGKVLLSSGKPAVGVNVIIENTSKGAITKVDGWFEISNVKQQNGTLVISGVGYSNTRIPFSFNNKLRLEVSLEIKEESVELSEVRVQSSASKSAAQAQDVRVINLASSKIKSISIPQVINQTSGLKVRQSAGIGSESEININGLQGNAVRFFKDGIPLDYLGRAFNLTLIPVDALQRLDVYKGVLPASLGSDALGGGVNFVTKENSNDYVDVSYQYGSFNSHQFSLNAHYNFPNSKFGINTSNYFISSDNNYKIDVLVPDPETAREAPATVERFHDGIHSFYSEIKAGYSDITIADKLELGLNYFKFDKELQNDLLQTLPYGEATFEEENFGVNLHYKKQFTRFKIDVFAVYSEVNTKTIDTTNNRYNWFGEIERVSEIGGEIGQTKTLQDITFSNSILRTYFDYDLTERHKIILNHVFSSQSRLGTNPFGNKIVNTDIDPLTIEAIYRKNITGLGLQSSFLEGKLINELTIKRFAISTQAVDIGFAYTGDVPKRTEENYGIGNSLRYNFDDSRFIRFSYEHTTRIPDAEEYFGDGLFVLGNSNLVPERSHNFNLGGSSHLNSKKTAWIDLNLFYRDQSDLVQFIPRIPFSNYENWSNARVKGIELGFRNRFFNRFKTNCNVTYQDLRRVNIDNPQEQLNEGSRIPNIPYLFANFNKEYQLPNAFVKQDRLDLYSNVSYTQFYYRFSIPKELESNNIFEKPNVNADQFLIPTQFVWDIGATYKFTKIPLWFNLAINNVLDESVFDNFRVQRPGRNFNFKIRYTIN